MSVKLFVGGLSYNTSEESFRLAFAAYGLVESATIVTDRDTGRSKGFGFVEMVDAVAADKAMEKLDGSRLDGRVIHVERAKSKERDRGYAGGRRG